MSSDFLSRWSRLKRQAERPTPEPPTPEPGHAAPEPPASDLPPEELAFLPSLDDLTAQTDLTPFFRQGVPAAMRNAALRRMWSLDPAIRDYVSEAREYAYDWNVAGAVPGTGPLLPTDSVENLLSAVFRDPVPRTPDPMPEAAAAEPSVVTTAEGDQADAASCRASTPEKVLDAPKPAETALNHAVKPEKEPKNSPEPVFRRHGGATPV